jgi:hypothetical protein
MILGIRPGVMRLKKKTERSATSDGKVEKDHILSMGKRGSSRECRREQILLDGIANAHAAEGACILGPRTRCSCRQTGGMAKFQLSRNYH